jgi:hypothetical protein
MDQHKPNETNAVDSRIAAVIARRAGASSSEQYPVTIEQGQEPQRTRLPKGQIDATVKFSTVVEPEKSKEFKPADELNENHPEPSEAETIVIGDSVVIRPNPLYRTWEGRFTPGADGRYEVLLNGQRMVGDAALSTVYDTLRAQQGTK